MSAARDLRPQVNKVTRTGTRPFAVPDGDVWRVVQADPRYDQEATTYLDALGLGDLHVFTDGSSLHYNYTDQRWYIKRGTITSFGGARTLRRTRTGWRKELAP